jgi:hypothetical protein
LAFPCHSNTTAESNNNIIPEIISVVAFKKRDLISFLLIILTPVDEMFFDFFILPQKFKDFNAC